MRLHFSSSSYWICYLFSFKSIYITKSTNLYKLILYIPTSSSSFSSTGKLLVLLRGLMLSRSIKQKVNRVIPTPIQDCFFLAATRVRVWACEWVLTFSMGSTQNLYILFIVWVRYVYVCDFFCCPMVVMVVVLHVCIRLFHVCAFRCFASNL